MIPQTVSGCRRVRTVQWEGLATPDYDLDGDQNLVVANGAGHFTFYENRQSSGNWLQIRPVTTNNATAIGAQVYVTADDRTQFEPLNSKADFRFRDSRMLHFGRADTDSVCVRVLGPTALFVPSRPTRTSGS